MPKMLISFKELNVRCNGKWLYGRAQKMRFEWIALLALKRMTQPGDRAWVTLEEIARLPSWSGRTNHHIGTNLGRYLRSVELNQHSLVTTAAPWVGPYRLGPPALSVGFDIPVSEVRRRLHLRVRAEVTRSALLKFTLSFARAEWLMFHGRLVPRLDSSDGENAYDRFVAMSAERSFGPTLRTLACIKATDVLYRRGRIRAARQFLLDNINLMRRTSDQSLKAQFHLKLAWAYQRASTGPLSDRAVKMALARASSYAENSGDRASLGLLSLRTSGYLTKKGRHRESVDQLVLALEAFLITGNYDAVQSVCGNLGSVIHRLGSRHYAEARQWLLAGIAVARWMRIGRDDAHSEMILGKIYAETGKKYLSRHWLKRATRIATEAGGRVNLADVRMVWAFWYKSFGARADQVRTLVEALRIFRGLKEFDCAQKEKYMARKFPQLWEEVLDGVD